MWSLVFLLCFIGSFGVQGYDYIVKVTTSNIEGAGTDSRITLKLIGTGGDSSDLRLEISGDSFEKGTMNRFVVGTANVGELCAIVIKSDNSGAMPAWHLEKIQIWINNLWPPYTFDCNCWISSDTQLERRLSPDIPCTPRKKGG